MGHSISSGLLDVKASNTRNDDRLGPGRTVPGRCFSFFSPQEMSAVLPFRLELFRPFAAWPLERLVGHRLPPGQAPTSPIQCF